MTPQAQSPTNCMHSLRNRLISEGSIVPSDIDGDIDGDSNPNGLEELRARLIKKIAEFHELYEEFNSSYAEGAIRILDDARSSLQDYDSASLDEKLRLFWMLRFSLLIDKFNKFTPTKQKTCKQEELFARSGFYSPLKENMKNTP